MQTHHSIVLLRHASIVISLGNKKILVDPMLSAKGEMDPVANCGNDIRIPMTDLPLDTAALGTLLSSVDAVIVTHLHRDHWDAAAQLLIQKDKPLFCQPPDADTIKRQGFLHVQAVVDRYLWQGIAISRTGGRHGTGEIGEKMGPVSGFVLSYNGTAVYIAGDTIWCPEVKDALQQFNPGYTIVNAGAAKFLTGDPITMTPQDILQVHMQLPCTKIIAVHMDTVNHCFIKRNDLRTALPANNWESWLSIPADGEQINIV